jgi:hypothetical protein
MTSKRKNLAINAAARNAVWVYPRLVPPRFTGAPILVETTRAHEMPDFSVLPEGSDVAVELYGGAVTLRLRGDLLRVYVERFTYQTFVSEKSARAAFLSLWREVERMESVIEIEQAAREWYERQAAASL